MGLDQYIYAITEEHFQKIKTDGRANIRDDYIQIKYERNCMWLHDELRATKSIFSGDQFRVYDSLKDVDIEFEFPEYDDEFLQLLDIKLKELPVGKYRYYLYWYL